MCSQPKHRTCGGAQGVYIMMRPVYFNESNVTVSYGETAIPALKDGKQVVSCWKMTWKDRISALLYGKVWVGIRGNSQYPIWLDSTRTVFVTKRKI